MLRFSCHRCRSVHELPADHAGRKIPCPKCGQRLQVPRPAKSKTVLAPIVASEPPPLPVDPVIAEARADESVTFSWAMVAIVVLFVLVCLSAAYAFGDPRVIAGAFIWVIIGLGLLGAIGIVAFFAFVYPSICPQCGRWFGTQNDGDESISTEKAFGLVRRRATTTGTSRSSGSTWIPGSMYNPQHSGGSSWIGGTYWKERVPVLRTTWRHFWSCKHCRAEWTTTSVEEAEDFSRE